jgi:hypothetical protein
MKTLLAAMISLLLVASPSVAFDDCHCHGCGCKGGPGWRVLGTRHCASWKRIDDDCGKPPRDNSRCRCEGVEQVCPSESETPIPPHKTGCN